MPHVGEQGHQHQTDSSRQSVHAVDQIDQVGHAHQPHHRNHPAPGAELDDLFGKRNLERLDADAEVANDPRNQDLGQQLSFRAERPIVTRKRLI